MRTLTIAIGGTDDFREWLGDALTFAPPFRHADRITLTDALAATDVQARGYTRYASDGMGGGDCDDGDDDVATDALRAVEDVAMDYPGNRFGEEDRS